MAEALLAPIDVTSAAVPGFDRARIADWLSVAIPKLSGPLLVEPATGGTSNPTNFVIFGKQRMVLRTKPSVQVSAAAYRINREYRLLTSLTGSAVPVLPRSSIATTRQ